MSTLETGGVGVGGLFDGDRLMGIYKTAKSAQNC